MSESTYPHPANLSPSERQYCRNALAIQDASNLSAVLRTFSEGYSALQRERGSDAAQRHPATLWFVSKICSMTGFDSSAFPRRGPSVDSLTDLAWLESVSAAGEA